MLLLHKNSQLHFSWLQVGDDSKWRAERAQDKIVVKPKYKCFCKIDSFF